MGAEIVAMNALPLSSRFRIWANIAGGVCLVVAALLIGAHLGSPDGPGTWPYRVKDRHLAADTITHDDELAMQRLIEYDVERGDCWRKYDRRLNSLNESGPRKGMVFRPEPFVEEKLPVDLSNRWQTWSTKLPEDFPCGPAYLVETVTVVCTPWQRLFPLQREIRTKFTVACSSP